MAAGSAPTKERRSFISRRVLRGPAAAHELRRQRAIRLDERRPCHRAPRESSPTNHLCDLPREGGARALLAGCRFVGFAIFCCPARQDLAVAPFGYHDGASDPRGRTRIVPSRGQRGNSIKSCSMPCDRIRGRTTQRMAMTDHNAMQYFEYLMRKKYASTYPRHMNNHHKPRPQKKACRGRFDRLRNPPTRQPCVELVARRLLSDCLIGKFFSPPFGRCDRPTPAMWSCGDALRSAA